MRVQGSADQAADAAKPKPDKATPQQRILLDKFAFFLGIVNIV